MRHPALPGRPKTAPPSCKLKPKDLTENWVLLGSPQRICRGAEQVGGGLIRGDVLRANQSRQGADAECRKVLAEASARVPQLLVSPQAQISFSGLECFNGPGSEQLPDWILTCTQVQTCPLCRKRARCLAQ